MKIKKLILPLALMFLIFGALWWMSSGGQNKLPPQNIPATGSLGPKQDSQGAVTADVTPLGISPNAPLWQFKIILNTHSVELSDDLTQTTVLADGAGNTYKPLSWQGSPPGGHHREGVLNFSPINPFPKSIELRMINVGGIPNRNFAWDL